MFKNSKNSREQGSVGVAQAIGWFVKEGYNVSIPISECQRYDLIIEKQGKLKKVEVKTSSFKAPSGNYEVNLKTCGGNQSWNKVIKRFDKNEVDYLFILTESEDKYVIPAKNANATTVTLGKKYKKYKVI